MNNRQLFQQFLAQTSEAPLSVEFVRASGCFMYDNEGRAFLDLISGISVSNVGHCHPEVVKAVQEQAQEYMHLMVYGEYIQKPQVQLAKLICDHLPSKLDNVYFTNSGSEAVEGALKLAKRFTGRHEIVAFKNAYHGSTQGALSVLGDENMKNAFRPLLPSIRFLSYNNESDLEQISTATACVIVETIQGEAGAICPQNDFLKKLRQKCNETGALLILDEIQAGCGRSGSLWAFEQYGIFPDILTLAKGLGGGMPIGAFIAPQKIMHSLTHNPVLGHISTFGGNAVCAAAAKANLEIIVRDKLWENAARLEAVFKSALHHPKIVSVRGKGLMLAVEFDSYETNRAIIDRLIEKGIMTDWFLFAANCLRIAPPLTINDEQVKDACSAIIEVCNTF